MEGREENSNGTAIPKKSRSLDLKSLYKSKLTEESGSKKSLQKTASSSSPGGGGDEKRFKRKRARKEVSLSSLEDADGSRKKGVDEEGQRRPSSGGKDLPELKLGLSQRLSGGSGLNRAPLSVGGDGVCIPKRKRNFVGRKKSQVGQASNLVGQASGTIDHDSQVPKLGSDDLGKGVADSSKIKYLDEFKENGNSDSVSVQHIKGNGDRASHSVVNSGDSSLTKTKKKVRKRKALASDRIRVPEKAAEPFIDSCKISDDLQEDDEENLEENAARMLSSRFDPSCTGFSSSGKSSPMPSANGLSFLLSSGRNTVNRGSKSRSGSESASVDAAGRTLRPRKQHNDKGTRKRRHFYEILYADVDAYWLLNKRIKVFWPLDQSWYFGLVNDYDEVKKLHHIKYDDRDEEWINLQTERFKLLLLRCEVPGSAKGGRALAKRRSSDQQNVSKSRRKRQREEITGEDSCGGSSMDSQPIISWLARSSHRLKSSCHGGKKQKTSVMLPSTTSSLLYDEPVAVKGHAAKNSLRDVENNLSSDSVSHDKLGDNFREKFSLQSSTCTKDDKKPIVYFRKRFRRSAPISPHVPEGNHVSISSPCSVSFDLLAGRVQNVKEPSGRVEIQGPLYFTYNEGVSKIFWEMELASFKFDLKFPIRLVLNEAFQSENLWLPYAALLFQCGAVMTTWPRVSLEMLFVDNVVGLRLLLFEGCLKMAAAFVFFVLRVFRQPACRGMSDLQLPVTSIGFKFSSLHVIKKPLVFVLYNFSRVKNSQWVYLDSKLKRHCQLSKQLHLSECTYDNIQALQNGYSEFPRTSISESSSFKVLVLIFLYFPIDISSLNPLKEFICHI